MSNKSNITGLYFDDKVSMRSSFGEQYYKDMINDGYIVTKKDHNKITCD